MMSAGTKKNHDGMTDDEIRAYVKELIKKEGLPSTPELTDEQARRILNRVFSAKRGK